jgi:hypothetical protein
MFISYPIAKWLVADRQRTLRDEAHPLSAIRRHARPATTDRPRD